LLYLMTFVVAVLLAASMGLGKKKELPSGFSSAKDRRSFRIARLRSGSRRE